eukprot:scaffold176200_cov16-Tisochrysis_lutea.AAC.2
MGHTHRSDDVEVPLLRASQRKGGWSVRKLVSMFSASQWDCSLAGQPEEKRPVDSAWRCNETGWVAFLPSLA